MEEKNNIIKFPIDNTRLDLSGIAVDTEEIMNNILDMKKIYFSEIADALVDDVMRNVDSLCLEESRMWRGGMDVKDVICIKEAIVAGLCRSMGINHPLHDIMDNNITRTDDSKETKYDNNINYSYTFKQD